MTINEVFPFRSDLKRMTTICTVQNFGTFAKARGQYALVKGAPEVIHEFVTKKDENFVKAAQSFMKQGYRVLGLAYKKLGDGQKIESRDEAERDLTYGGLLVLNCPLKSDTADYIKILQAANYKNVMITGDSMYTAASTGAKLNFGTDKHLFLVPEDQEGAFVWMDIEDRVVESFSLGGLAKLQEQYCLCVEGKSMLAMEKLQDKSILEGVILNSIIFARVSPEQKEKIITIFKEAGNSVLMCGDGTNDVAALKKSDVGVALVGLKDEPTKEEKKAEKDRKAKLRREAMKNRRYDLL